MAAHGRPAKAAASRGRGKGRGRGTKAVAAPRVVAAASSSSLEGSVGDPFAVDALVEPVTTGFDNLAALDSKRRRLSRRDSEDQVKRLLDKNLIPKFGKEVVGKLGLSDLSVFEWMLVELRQLKADKKYWTSLTWQKLYKEFGLILSVEDSLDAPCGPANVDQGLFDALKGPHTRNCAERTAETVERYLESCKKLNMHELNGLLVSCGESPVVTKLMHSRLYVAIGKYFSRTLMAEILIGKIGPFPTSSFIGSCHGE